MRKFIISDLHGCGEVYDSIIGYLDNIGLMDDVVLYINGDLIDRGLDGYRMLIDVMERINGKGNIKIHYLGGNHELMMYQALLDRKPHEAIDFWGDWMLNGGWVIEGELDCLENGEEKCEELKSFLGNLDIYKAFSEIIDGNRLLLVHAQAPSVIKDKCNIKIADNSKEVFDSVWNREEIREGFLFSPGIIVGYNKLGHDGFLTIIGHTPVEDEKGFYYKKDGNYINIDGGCAAYAIGRFERNRVPLVEVLDDKLEIIIFNHNNEIIDGYYFDGDINNMNKEEINYYREFINHSYD